MKTIHTILAFSTLGAMLLSGCKAEEIMMYQGDSYIQFSNNKNYLHYSSFVFDPLDVSEKVFELELTLLGRLSDAPRYFSLRQIEYVEWIYTYNNFGIAIDSVRKDIPQATEGKYFRMPTDDILFLGPNELTVKIPITLLRGPELNKANRFLRLELEEVSPELKPGTVNKQSNVVVVSDMFVPPTRWVEDSQLVVHILGPWTSEKHRVMYLSTGIHWENKDFDLLDDSYGLIYYINKFSDYLDEYEEEHGERLKDENGEMIYFPADQ